MNDDYEDGIEDIENRLGLPRGYVPPCRDREKLPLEEMERGRESKWWNNDYRHPNRNPLGWKRK
ncbi:hypothetical protein AKJ36_00035 [candidate division MSBL1 archaeon SCGC-AAA259I07]|uniref:Uncharacterized protein n=1 Tax=candidate division MSBL1 archaeon SCGC-AAA259I07 TaxID=1698266 RepID=A0A133UN08_9EURY|nr:hypothetical protein AKJ36_00035 [candidate division MSBL1 archaeon SCGC-AAA259I07]